MRLAAAPLAAPKTAANGTVSFLPSVAMLFAMCGCFLLVAATAAMPLTGPGSADTLHHVSGPLEPTLIALAPSRGHTGDHTATARPGTQHGFPHRSQVVASLHQANGTYGDEGLADQDMRWYLMEMAGAQHGHWGKLCPCPVYAIEHPSGSPR